MSIFEVNRRIKAHPSVVWKIISDHENFVEVAPHIVKLEKLSEGTLGMICRLHHKSGRVWEEKCTDWQENKSFTMKVINGDHPLPVKRIARTCSMQEDPLNILLTLKFEYTPKYAIFGGILNKLHILPILKIYSHQLIDNLVAKINDEEWGYHVTAATIIKQKNMGIVTISPEMTSTDANKFRAEHRIGYLVVVDENKRVVGVLSERDIVNAISKNGYEIMEKPVSEIMTCDVTTCKLDDSLQELMSIMTEQRFRHLPVVDEEQLLGVISIGDVVKARMDEMEKESKAMRNYIKDRRWRELSLQIGRSGAAAEYEKLDNVI
jgi:CBS domain-containing protein